MDLLDSNLLRGFLAVLEHRKLTAAADRLCVTQSALSKNLKKLEDELGVPLFERTTSGMVPTTYAIALGRRARLIDLESRSARAELKVLREGGFGTITIGIGPMWSVYVLPEVIAQIVQRQSKAQVRIVSGVLNTLLPALLKGELDLVGSTLDFPDHPDLVKEELLDNEHVLVARRGHPLLRQREVEPAHLARYPFVGFTQDYAGLSWMEKYFSAHGIESPGHAVEVSSLEMVLSLLRAGDFIANLSTHVLERAVQLGLRKVPIRGSFWRSPAGLVYRKAPQPSPLTAMLVRALHQRLRPQA
ncbi:MAG: LysR family transcriptional regulator [Burkholderiales bacterium]|nr:LysR family transcriptional regulator [Burkholderiales bacterium]